MAPKSLLQAKSFFVGCEVIFSHLRLKESDRWSETVALLKLASFTEAFPEVNDGQFLWACEQWVQGAIGGKFHNFPTWRELMAPLYRRENGLANRSWGFNPSLPPFLQPTAQQLLMLPKARESLLPCEDPSQERWLTPATMREWTAADGSQMAFEPNDELPRLRGANPQEES